MKKITRICAAVTVITFMTGCATASKDVATAYVSPLQYKDYNCNQLVNETTRLNGRITQLGGRLDEAANNDKAIAGVGVILFWPALFALGGTKQQEAEYGRLKGEYDALNQALVQKDCKLVTEQPKPVALMQDQSIVSK